MNRREIISAVGGLILGAESARAARPERMKPQVGDLLVHAFGDSKGVEICPVDIQEQIVFAFARSTEGVVRDGSLNNQVSLLRVDESLFSEQTREFAAGAIVAVSSSCTHTGCEVSGWQPEVNELVCPCHGSRFYVPEASRVVQGPATKPLALLPIEEQDGWIRVVGDFSRRVGPAPTF